MNIDTLKNIDGTFRKADTRDVEFCLDAGYTTHLRTERGTMAFRPLCDGSFVVSRCVPGQQQQDKHFEGISNNGRDRIIRAALLFLNGEQHPYQPGDDFYVYANQAERDGYVLAVIGNELLLEYTMPNGTSALRIVQVVGTRVGADYKTVSYTRVPKKWLRAIEVAGMTDWIGQSQSAGFVPFPEVGAA